MNFANFGQNQFSFGSDIRGLEKNEEFYLNE